MNKSCTDILEFCNKKNSFSKKTFFFMVLNTFIVNSSFSDVLKPLENKSENWKKLEYKNIKPNRVEFKKKSLSINVEESSSPVVYVFDEKVKVKKVSVEGKVYGTLKLNMSNLQGEKNNDDYLFRLGLVISGKKRLNFIQKIMAPPWIKTLYVLASHTSEGIDQVYFLNLGSEASHMGRVRQHPRSKLITEEIVSIDQGTGQFVLKKTFKDAKNILALWISCDGDDTGSQYSIELNQLMIDAE